MIKALKKNSGAPLSSDGIRGCETSYTIEMYLHGVNHDIAIMIYYIYIHTYNIELYYDSTITYMISYYNIVVSSFMSKL